jgi:TonB family protein
MLLSHPGDDALMVYGSKLELLKLRAELTKDPHDTEIARQQRAMMAVGAVPTPTQELLGRMARDYASVRVVSRSDLAYPEEARYAHIQGDVPIAVDIDESGVVVEVTVLGEERLPVLTRAAVEAVRHWRYEPLVVDRIPRRASALVFFSFVLKPSP